MHRKAGVEFNQHFFCVAKDSRIRKPVQHARHQMRIFLLLFLLCCFAPAPVQVRADIQLSDRINNLSLRTFSYAHVPEEQKIETLTPDILQGLSFTGANKTLPNFGYSRGQIIARFSVSNQSRKHQWILRLGNPHLKKIIFYEEKGNQLEEKFRTGIDDPFISRPVQFRDFWLPLNVEPQSQQTFYVVTQSGQWLSLVPSLSTPEVAQDIQNREWAFQLLGLGGIVFILLYNIFVYYVTRERVYLFYVLASIAVNILAIPGSAGLLVYIFPYSPVLVQDLWFASAIGWIALTSLFARSFLLKNTDAVIEKRVLTYAAGLSAVLAPLPFIFGPTHHLAILFNLISGIFQFVILTIAWRSAFLRKYTPAVVFLCAWGVPIIAAIVFFAGTQGFYPVTDSILHVLTFSSVWEVVCMATALGYRIVDLQKEKEKTQAQLLEKAMLEGELQAARAVQEQLLPLPEKIDGLEYWAFFQPADTAGGDWYGYIHQREQNRITFYIGDITGHGITSAVLTGVVCGAVYSAETRSRQLEHISPPLRQLQLAAEALDTILHQTAGRTGRLMSMCFLSIDLRSGDACALNAGHTWPILARDENGSIRCEKIPGGGSLLGSGNHSFGVHEFKLNSGDTLLLYTDGLVENEGQNGETLNFRKLRNLLSTPLSLSEQMGNLEQTVRNLWSGQKLSDDVTFLGIRFSGQST
jgi:serine phosphatase RsbU (regulator of sigma subunit)